MIPKIKIKTSDVSVLYQDFQALHGITMDIQENKVTALMVLPGVANQPSYVA